MRWPRIWWCWMGVVSLVGGQLPSSTVPPCPHECICLSQSQVLCNSASLRAVPLRLLPGTVEQLSITRADLRTLRSDAFAGLKQLRRLSLDGTNLTTIRPFAFRGLPRLRDISIQHTALTTVNAFAFAGLQNVTTILLGHNKISQVEGYAFAGTSYVRLIALNNNPMKRILSNAFSGLNEVERIVLPSGIRSVESDAFSGLEGIGVLRLGFMDLPALKANTFRGLMRVRTLALQESDLGIIRAGAFEGIYHVDSLEICNNKIDGVEELMLMANSSIKFLRFTGNHLLASPASSSLQLEVDGMKVAGNHFPCECGVRDLLAGALADSVNFPEENFCISPMALRGKSLAEAELLACGPSGGGSAGARAARAGGERVTPALFIVTTIVLIFITCRPIL